MTEENWIKVIDPPSENAHACLAAGLMDNMHIAGEGDGKQIAALMDMLLTPGQKYGFEISLAKV